MEIRAATDEDVEDIVRLQCERNGPECDLGVRSLFDRPDVGPRCFAVAVEGDGTVVSALCLVPERLRVGGVTVRAGQVEYVATAATHEGQGLVRRLMDLAHRWSAEDENLVELIAGIPYLYRRFGYEYALPFPRVRLVSPGVSVRVPEGWRARPATATDVDDLVRLQAAAQGASDVAVVDGDEDWWRWWIGTGQEPTWWVALDPAGAVSGAGTLGSGPPGIDGAIAMVGAPAADEPAALLALLAEAVATGRPAAIEARHGVTTPLDGSTHLHPRRYSVYVRIADPVAFVDALRPELDRRLAASPWRDATGTLTVCLYTRAFAIACREGRVEDVSWLDRADAGRGVDVPPDRIASLLLGRHGAVGLAEREDDVRLAPRAAGVADALFPRLTADVSLL